MKVIKSRNNYLIELTQTEINHIEKNKLIIKVDNVKDSYDFSNAEENIFTTEKYPMTVNCKKFNLVLDKEDSNIIEGTIMGNYSNPFKHIIINVFINLAIAYFIYLVAKMLFNNNVERRLTTIFSVILSLIVFVNIIIALIVLVNLKKQKQVFEEVENEKNDMQIRIVYMSTIVNIGLFIVFALTIIINKIGG